MVRHGRTLHFNADGTDEVGMYHEKASAPADRATALPAATGSANR